MLTLPIAISLLALLAQAAPTPAPADCVPGPERICPPTGPGKAVGTVPKPSSPPKGGMGIDIGDGSIPIAQPIPSPDPGPAPAPAPDPAPAPQPAPGGAGSVQPAPGGSGGGSGGGTGGGGVDVNAPLNSGLKLAGPELSLMQNWDWEVYAKYVAIAKCNRDNIVPWTCVRCKELNSRGKHSVKLHGKDFWLPKHYVVVNEDQKHAILAIEGTIMPGNVYNLQNAVAIPDSDHDPGMLAGVKVQQGFYNVANGIEGSTRKVLTDGVDDGSIQHIIIAGHSQGASAAEILGPRLTKRFAGKASVTVRGFNPLRVGSTEWADYVEATMDPNRFRYAIHSDDWWPHYPGSIRYPPEAAKPEVSLVHPRGEIWVTPGGEYVDCPGRENNQCAMGRKNLNDKHGPFWGVELSCNDP